jgi:hypothetical protein
MLMPFDAVQVRWPDETTEVFQGLVADRVVLLGQGTGPAYFAPCRVDFVFALLIALQEAE